MRKGEEVRGNPSAPRVVISGTGRSGTTFLVRLLTALGVDTGYVPDTTGWYLDEVGGFSGSGTSLGGLERHPRAGWKRERLGALPYVVKDPRLCYALEPLIDAGTFRVEVLLYPSRDLVPAALSRIRRNLLWLPDPVDGDPDRERVLRPGEEPLPAQLSALRDARDHLLYTCATRGIRIVEIPFPTLCHDLPAIRELLLPVLPAETSPSVFETAYRSCHAGLP